MKSMQEGTTKADTQRLGQRWWTTIGVPLKNGRGRSSMNLTDNMIECDGVKNRTPLLKILPLLLEFGHSRFPFFLEG